MALYSGIGLRSFDALSFIFDQINVSFEDISASLSVPYTKIDQPVPLSTKIGSALPVFTKAEIPTAVVSTQVVQSSAPTYTRLVPNGW